ncbi:carboxyphosphonoenolpyruvate phosphonomutase [Ceratobasidium sp. AG-Ba]|nr:carboxyphosphonoenolpyruvate phosphonomutase [Ceratobasidium sp. AG-Ba]QRW04490.1 carboxyphosphonoenolpyruvate phosphonomutase [Ceratobasidium sp. AG-Ba]
MARIHRNQGSKVYTARFTRSAGDLAGGTIRLSWLLPVAGTAGFLQGARIDGFLAGNWHPKLIPAPSPALACRNFDGGGARIPYFSGRRSLARHLYLYTPALSTSGLDNWAPDGTYIKPAHLIHSPDKPLHWKASTCLRQMLDRDEIVVVPGLVQKSLCVRVCDGLSARCALEAGFTCLYQSGAAATAAKLGQPDLAIATLADFVQNATVITGLSYFTPLIADADTGFGGPAMVARTVQMYDRAGVAALHIEDQAAADVGADVAFVEGVKTQELLEKTVKALTPTPFLMNVISGGLTPSFTTKEAEKMGDKIIIFSLVSCVAAVHGIREAMASLKKTGTDHQSAQGMDPRAFLEGTGLDEVIEVDRRAGGAAMSSI